MPWHETEALFQSTLRAAKDTSPNEDNIKSLEVVDLGEAGRHEVWQSSSRTISKTIAKHGGTYPFPKDHLCMLARADCAFRLL
jgi:abhydrolase domain-containing protein 12